MKKEALKALRKKGRKTDNKIDPIYSDRLVVRDFQCQKDVPKEWFDIKTRKDLMFRPLKKDVPRGAIVTLVKLPEDRTWRIYMRYRQKWYRVLPKISIARSRSYFREIGRMENVFE